MASFPSLSSGVISQYPTESFVGQSVAIIRFLDGSDQRFILAGRRLRRWRIDLTLLSDEEVLALESFFDAQKGQFLPFTFTDPASDTLVPNCRLADSEMTTEYLGRNTNSTLLWIIETNG